MEAKKPKRISFDRKEVLMFILANILALATSQSDEWIIYPGLLVSWGLILCICYIHEGGDKWRLISACAATVIIGVFAGRVFWRQSHPHDFIEGTSMSRTALKEQMPFGYAIFRNSIDTEIWQPNPLKHIEWSVDWGAIIATPDKTNKKVIWQIRSLEVFESDNGVRGKQLVDLKHFTGTYWMVLNKPIRLTLVGVKDEPEVFVETLSDNQRTPIFVLGLRINIPD